MSGPRKRGLASSLREHRGRRPDRVSLVAGVAVTLLGVLLLLAQTHVIKLHFDYVAPAVLATAGVILLASGLDR